MAGKWFGSLGGTHEKLQNDDGTERGSIVKTGEGRYGAVARDGMPLADVPSKEGAKAIVEIADRLESPEGVSQVITGTVPDEG